ncbi:9-cis-epoxycarotenoid dioxygenase NCED1, chloroplastic-like [Phragmites australis]|uniref:9-cis-epoxycarotenoid dioxygenase NCED1, chloroplastic-like n=1 Tax=Phragmites australis TaxID=29695 RepID=UPI002D774E26|nr:9-cis-epoxycarotenoid dioxygenase NCED1, chloroplastic-like [Phragmites australis]
MERTLITSNLCMSDLYPVTAAHASRSSRRVHYISPAASAAARNSSYRKKKSTPSPPPSAAATVLTSPPATDNVEYTTPKQIEKQEQEEPAVAKINNSRIATARAGRASSAAPSQAQARPRRRPTAAAASLPMAFCNALEEVINTFVDPPALRPSVDPRNVLSSNFAPVDELPPTPCPVVRGAIPRCLAGGAYIRNGPNPQHLPRGPHHLFDGDGMLHSLLLPTASSPSSDPVLCSRYVQTYKYLVERDAGAPVMPNVFSGFHGVAGMVRGAVVAARVLTGQMNPAEGVGLANTSLAFFGGRLYALGESDLPYAVRVVPATGEVITHGRCDFGGRLVMGMTAHPKKDPVTGELFAFRYGPVPPFVTYFRFDPAGNKGPDVPIFSVQQPSFLHDFAVTERYAIFPEIQIVMKPMDMVVGGGAPVGSDSGKVPRLGVLPKYATDESEMRWFEVPGFNMMHSLNAWEEADGEQLVLVAPNVLSIEHALERLELVHSSVELVRLNLRTGDVSRTPLSAGNLDFGVIHPGYLGRRNRYGYLGIGDPMPKIAGVAKLDFDRAGTGDCTVARRDFGPGCFAGEPFFVPDDVEGDGNEDDGYLVCYVHNERTGENRFVVMDARSPQLDIVAEVQLPARVPYGFHGLFVTQAQLRSQQQ